MMQLDEALRAKVVETAIAVLEKEYLFPTAVGKIARKLRANLAAKRYDGIKSPEKLAKLLSADLAEAAGDDSLRIEYSDETVPEDRPLDHRMGPDERARMRTHAGQFNSFFTKVERLPGNIGYVHLTAIVHPMVAAGPLAAAMSFVADTAELIVDLRSCGGSDPETVALMVSYLHEPGDPIHVTDVYWRAGESTHQYWTVADVAGQRYAGKPVYVLTSGRTSGSAEDFASWLRAAKRAKLVGEPTAGLAYHVRRRRLAPHFAFFLPMGRSVSASSGRTWHGTGIKPDIAVPHGKALDTAYAAALKAVRKRTDPKKMPRDFVPSFSDELDRAIEDVPGAKKR